MRLNPTSLMAKTKSSSSPSKARVKKITKSLIGRVDQLLLSNIEIIKKEVSEQGVWHIPEKIQNQMKNELPKAEFIKIIGSTKSNSNAIKIFKKSTLVLDKFCLLKIKEIRHFLRESTAYAASSDVTLSCFEHIGQGSYVKVQLVKIKFNEHNLAETIKNHPSTKSSEYKSTLLGLKQSSWLTNFTNETIIRFSDRKLENKLSIKAYCDGIDYAVTTDQVKKSVGRRKNFWEMFAVRRSRKGTDFSIIPVVEERFNVMYSIQGPDKLENHIEELAKFRENIDQSKYVLDVLRNQRAGIGSLLYLPTGFGKTFIMLLAMAQHYRNLPPKSRKPYLVVIPKLNVRDAWDSNITLLKELEEKQKQLLFGTPFIRKKVETSAEFSEYLESYDPDASCEEHLILVTRDVLANTVDNLFQGKGANNLVKKYAEFLRESGVIVGDRLVIGNNEIDWRKRIKLSLSYMRTPTEVFELLAKKLFKTHARRNNNTKEELCKSFFDYPGSLSKLSQLLRDEELEYLETHCHLPSTGERMARIKKLYSHIKGFYQFSALVNKLRLESFRGDEVDALFKQINIPRGRKKKVKSLTLLEELTELSSKQISASEEYKDFFDVFGGLILDESQDLLITNPKNLINSREILLEMSEYYQTVAQPGERENRLVIAASATPWPNDLNQLRLHIEFLAAGLMKDSIEFNYQLFSLWACFERELKIEADAHIQGKIETLQSKSLKKKISKIQNYFFPWVRMIFKGLVLVDEATQGKTNIVSERLMYINCTKKNKVQIKQSGKEVKSASSSSTNALHVIKKFYSTLLGPYYNEHNVLKKSENHFEKNTILDFVKNQKQNDYSVALKKCLEVIQENPYSKIAIYLEEQKDALLLEQYIENFYKEKLHFPCIEIGFFYEKGFVKKQKQKKTHRVYNKDRKVNKNAFNNIFSIEDYKYFISERFYSGKLKFFRKRKGKDFISRVNSLYFIFKAAEISDKSERREVLRQLEDLNKLKEFESVDEIIRGSETYLQKHPYDKRRLIESIKIKNKELQGKVDCFFRFMELIIKFERSSHEEIIYFHKGDDINWLPKFKEYLPSSDTRESNVVECFSRFRAHIDTQAKTKNKLADTFIESLQYSLLYYIHKIYLSRVFIFGQAGTAGMRADADILFMFSGAWTEGRLAQIRGRVGRLKGKNPARPCVIHAPLTNTYFELFILKYYILKALYNQFVTSITVMKPEELCVPIFLAHALYGYYVNNSNAFIDQNLFVKVLRLETKESGSYSQLTPFDKAKHIIPDSLNEVVKNFAKLIRQLKADKDLDPDPDPDTDTEDEIAIEEEQDSTINDSWGRAYSEIIKQYCKSRGWEENLNDLGEGTAGEILASLVDPIDEMTVSTEWKATNRVVGEPEYVNNTHQESTAPEGPQHVEQVVPPIIHYPPEFKHPNLVVIDEKIFRKIYSKDNYCIVKKTEKGLERTTYEAQKLNFEIAGAPESFYVKFSSPVDPQTEIKSRTIKINTTNYFLFAYVAGGNVVGSSHYWTYRKSENGYYKCDDLSSTILHIKNQEFPILSSAHLFKFVREDRFSEHAKLIPKTLFNTNNNCFINAAYQLADTLKLRKQIKAFKGMQVISSGSSQYPVIGREKQPPKIIPYIKPHFESNWTEENWHQIQKFCDRSKQQIILMLPTRGEGLDFDVARFAGYVSESSSRSNYPDAQIYLLFGINGCTNKEVLKRLQCNQQKMNSYLSSKKSNKLYIKLIPFQWQESDKWGGKLPLGQMRNFCLEKSRQLWNHLTEARGISANKISLISMDGDIQIRSRSFNRCLSLGLEQFAQHCVFVTCGYEIPFINSKGVNSQLENMPTTQGKDEWLNYWTALVNHASMNVNTDMYLRNSHGQHNYVAYPAEPLIYLNPKLLELFFTSGRENFHLREDATLDNKAVFGYWDKEGRRFLTTMKNVCKNNNIIFEVRGPGEIRTRPILHQYKRFKIDLQVRVIKQQLSYNDLSRVISRMTHQTQSSFRPYFMGSNIASALNLEIHLVRSYTAYFYVNNFLKLLKLGPERAHIFSIKIGEIFFNEKGNYRREDKRTFGCSAEVLNRFIEENFGKHIRCCSQDQRNMFLLLTHWVRAVSQQLMKWFDKYYINERVAGSRKFSSMEFPKNYPRLSKEALEQEEKQFTQSVVVSKEEVKTNTIQDTKQTINLEILSQELMSYLINSVHYALYPKISKIALATWVKIPQLKFVGVSSGNSILAILNYDELKTDNIYERVKDISISLAKNYRRKCIALFFIKKDNKITFRYCFNNYVEYVIEDNLPPEDDHSGNLSLAQINRHCLSIRSALSFGHSGMPGGIKQNIEFQQAEKGSPPLKKMKLTDTKNSMFKNPSELKRQVHKRGKRSPFLESVSSGGAPSKKRRTEKNYGSQLFSPVKRKVIDQLVKSSSQTINPEVIVLEH